MSRTLLIGPRIKNNASGPRIGFESLVDGFEKMGYPFSIVDLSIGSGEGKIGSFRIKRLLSSLLIIIKAVCKMLTVDTVYLIISSSRFGFFRDFLIIWPAYILKKKIVLHLKGGGYKEFYLGQPQFYQQIIRCTLGRVTHIVVLGELLREQFTFVPDIEKKIKIVLNGLAKDLQAEDHRIKCLPKPNELIHILYMSNLITSKGYLDLLKACIELKTQGFSNFVCDFCGSFIQTEVDVTDRSSNEQKKEFFEIIATHGLHDNITYHGVVSGRQKEDMLRAAHIFVLPTYYIWEGQPISIIEAMAYATPIVSTKHKGIPEQLIDGYNGIAVLPRNPTDIAQAIKRIISSNSDYTEMSRNSRDHFEKHFTRDKHLERLTAIIINAKTNS